MKAWRLGPSRNPCAFKPRYLLGLPPWPHRFDDVKGEFRTIYCAKERITCIREVLADLRPDTKALHDFSMSILPGHEYELIPAGIVSREWRLKNILVQVDIILEGGSICNVDDAAVRARMERQHARLLRDHGMTHLDVSEIRCEDRVVTQTIARSLFDDGFAGIRFGSNLDNLHCYALFEGRVRILPSPASRPVSMSKNDPDLVRVCGEYGLVLRPAR